MNIYKNKKIAIIGLGKTGISCINFFKKKKSYIYAMDKNKNIYINNINYSNIKINLGCFKISWILSADLIVLSPGISLNTPEILIAKLYNLDIVNDIEIFCREKKTANIIAITGSNGKSSVTTLVYKIIKHNNINVCIGGNIGIPVLNLLKKKYDIYVFELSSFQLETIKNLKTKISVILNISNNHLDRHKNIDIYKEIKLKIYNNSENCVFNKDDINTYPLIKKNNTNYINFGLWSGNYHLISDKNKLFLSKENKKFLNCNFLKLHGNHSYLNILAAIAITDLIKKNLNESQIYVFKKFSGLNHRLKLIKTINKIKWINDSKSTNQNSTIIAINSIKKFNYIHLLLGGYSKSNDFKILSNFIKYKRIILYFFGIDGEKISKFFKNYYIYRKDLKSLMLIINKIAKNNDVVLLSPSCSSIDQYKSFEYRGNNFIKILNDFKKNNLK